LGALNRLTDTTDQLEYCLTEKDPYVQLHALRWLQDIFSKRHQEMPPAAVSVLVQLLQLRGDTVHDMQILWQATAIAGKMGPQAKLLIPLLQNLMRISAKESSYSEWEVYHFADEALQKINGGANASPVAMTELKRSDAQHMYMDGEIDRLTYDDMMHQIDKREAAAKAGTTPTDASAPRPASSAPPGAVCACAVNRDQERNPICGKIQLHCH